MPAFFDIPRLVRHLEELYRQMWDDFEQGKLSVPDLSNLDVYHEIGTTPITPSTTKNSTSGIVFVQSGAILDCGKGNP
jgi:hypothetical protein